MLRCFPAKANATVHRVRGKKVSCPSKGPCLWSTLFHASGLNVCQKRSLKKLYFSSGLWNASYYKAMLACFYTAVHRPSSLQRIWSTGNQMKKRLTSKNKYMCIYLVWSGNLPAEAHSALTSISVVSLEMQGDKNVCLYTYRYLQRYFHIQKYIYRHWPSVQLQNSI